jgi:pSer/pThr/pTyr-binding forkhead associated (FHA) protein
MLCSMTAAVLDRTRHEATAVWHLEHGRYLAVRDGDDVVVLPVRHLTRIGRALGADIVLADAPVSPRHAILLGRGDTVVIADERSRNGVLVNGRRVQEACLRNGDVYPPGPRPIRFLEV